MRLAAFVAALLFTLLAVTVHATLPVGFIDDVIVTGFVRPVDVAIGSSGRMFVAEKRGVVWLVDQGVRLPTPVINLVDEVNDAFDKGLLGITLDPAFDSNGFLYLVFAVDPVFGQPDEPAEVVTFSRLVRYTITGDVADPDSRLVLLGNDANDGLPSCHSSHVIGTVRFGNDGSLFLGSGDGAHSEYVDGGQDVTGYDPGCAETFTANQDLGALRAQSLETLAGKILRVDPATGLGLPDDPFWNGDPGSFASRIWTLGLRNPFRFTVRPASNPPGVLYVADVGWLTFEELNVAREGGENFGWPCYEGPGPQPLYQAHALTSAPCAGVLAGQVTPPLLAWHQRDPGGLGFTGNTASGVTFYDATLFPPEYRSRCFFSDFAQGWIRVLEVNELDQLVKVSQFANAVDHPVDLEVDPATGELVYVSISSGALRRIWYTTENVPPIAHASAIPSVGFLPLEVHFSSDQTRDPNGDPITLSWDFGDGSARATEPNPVHIYLVAGTFQARLIVTDNSGLADSSVVTITTVNSPPSVRITSPLDGATFAPNETIGLRAETGDLEDGKDLSFSWEVDLIHDNHPHFGWFVSEEASPEFLAASHGDLGDRFSYRIVLVVTDTDGGAASDTVHIVPNDLESNNSPVALFRIDRHRGPAPLVVSFDAALSLDPHGDLLILDWNFGDGARGSGVVTTHVYGFPGLFPVTLDIRDPALATARASSTILVEPGQQIGAWNLDARSPGADESGQDRHAIIHGAIPGPGVRNDALVFDGLDDWVDVGEGFLSGMDGFTLAAWVRPNAPAAHGGILGQNDVIEFGFGAPGVLLLVTGAGDSLRAPYSHPFGEWHHVAATGSRARLTIRVDGGVVAERGVTASTFGDSNYDFHIGGGGIFRGNSDFFAGSLDDIRVHSRALGDSETLLLAQMPPANAAPIVNAGGDLQVRLDEMVILEGTFEDDALPSPPAHLEFAWTLATGPRRAGIFRPSSPYTLVTFAEPGKYVFTFSADDGQFLAEDTISIRVIDTQTDGLEGLRAVVPNPTRGEVSLQFGLVRNESRVRMTIHDISGRRIAMLWDGPANAGEASTSWNGKDQAGRLVATGVYLVSLHVGSRRYSQKLTWLR